MEMWNGEAICCGEGSARFCAFPFGRTAVVQLSTKATTSDYVIVGLSLPGSGSRFGDASFRDGDRMNLDDGVFGKSP